MKEARILLYDLEVTRATVEGYGPRWDFKVVKIVKPQKLMCYSYKWLGDKKVQFVSMHDFKTYDGFVQSLCNLLSECDIAIAHNGIRFDNKMSNTFIITERIVPPSPFKSIDTRLVAKREFNFLSNSLDDLAEHFGIGRKERITYADLEDEFLLKKPPKHVVNKMKRYNNQDVALLEQIYLYMRPFMRNHPNVLTYTEQSFGCPKCGSYDLHKRGTAVTTTCRYQRYQCMKCGGWCRERIADKDFMKPEMVNVV